MSGHIAFSFVFQPGEVAGVHAMDCVSAGQLVLLWGWNASVCIVVALKRASNFPHALMITSTHTDEEDPLLRNV